MILETYQANHLFFNTNFIEPTSDGSMQGYRGDLVIIDGGLDDKGHPNPPEVTIKGAVVLADDKIHMLIASLDQVEDIPTLLDRYQADFADDIAILLFVVNAKENAIYEIGSAKAIIIPLVQGVPWNEAIDELALEKSDFKGQKPADKIATVYAELKSYKAKGTVKSLDQLLADVTEEKREAWGAV
ncbi:hypothetical protein NBRC116494_22410 [Aurantivibrio plasticivorans]